MKEIELHRVSQSTFAQEKSAHANESKRENASWKTSSEVIAICTTYSVCGIWPWWQFDVKTEVKK